MDDRRRAVLAGLVISIVTCLLAIHGVVYIARERRAVPSSAVPSCPTCEPCPIATAPTEDSPEPASPGECNGFVLVQSDGRWPNQSVPFTNGTLGQPYWVLTSLINKAYALSHGAAPRAL